MKFDTVAWTDQTAVNLGKLLERQRELYAAFKTYRTDTRVISRAMMAGAEKLKKSLNHDLDKLSDDDDGMAMSEDIGQMLEPLEELQSVDADEEEGIDGALTALDEHGDLLKNAAKHITEFAAAARRIAAEHARRAARQLRYGPDDDDDDFPTATVVRR